MHASLWQKHTFNVLFRSASSSLQWVNFHFVICFVQHTEIFGRNFSTIVCHTCTDCNNCETFKIFVETEIVCVCAKWDLLHVFIHAVFSMVGLGLGWLFFLVSLLCNFILTIVLVKKTRKNEQAIFSNMCNSGFTWGPLRPRPPFLTKKSN